MYIKEVGLPERSNEKDPTLQMFRHSADVYGDGNPSKLDQQLLQG